MGKLLAFGEIMLRLSPPGRELLMQSPRFDVWVAGAEANVARALAHLGHDVGFASAVPDNNLGRAAVSNMRGAGVDTAGIQFRGERIGLCFVTTGAGLRATEVMYDRAHSSFADCPSEAWDWDALLAGVDRLHLSGITPALGEVSAASAIAAAKAASARGISVSFDGNWRGKLWDRRESDPRIDLTNLVAHADIMFGNDRDMAMLLGRDFSKIDEDWRREGVKATFAAFPKLQMIASTARHVEHVDLHRLSARIDTRDTHARTDEVVLRGIVDRIGSGDAFAAGVLHALRTGGCIADAARIGLALAALKHSLPGDACMVRQSDIDAYLAGDVDVRR